MTDKTQDATDAVIIDLLWDYLKRDPEHKDRKQTGWGTKTKTGLVASVRRAVLGDGPKTPEPADILPTDYHHDTLPDTGFPDSTTDERRTMHFQTALSGFLAAAQEKVNERMKPYAPMQAVRLETQDGQRYVRVVAIDIIGGQESGKNGSAYCFIDKENGNVLKPAGWKGPEKKNPRSNIYAPDFGASGVTGYGAVSLRR